jgi:hypothetical protein
LELLEGWDMVNFASPDEADMKSKSLLPIVILAVSVLGACAAPVDEYAGQPGAHRMLAKCETQAYASPVMVNASTSPFFAAGVINQYIDNCMEAAGYRSSQN